MEKIIKIDGVNSKINIDQEFLYIITEKSEKIHYKNILGLSLPENIYQDTFESKFHFVQFIQNNDKQKIEEIQYYEFQSTKQTLIQIRENILKWLYQFIEHKNKPFYQEFLFFRKSLVIINPFSGTKRAFQVFEESKQILESNGIYLDIVTTKPDPFLEDYIQSIEVQKLLEYDFICTISGDGSVNAILNGYFKRQDIDQNKNHLNLVMIPAGSGCLLFENAIKKSPLYDFSIENSLYVICHPNKLKMQIRKAIFQQKNKEIFSRYFFLYVHFGFIADCDSGSESLRFLGGPRYEIYAYYKTFFLQKYQAKIYIPKNNNKLPQISDQINEQNFEKLQGQYYLVCCQLLPYMNKGMLNDPLLIDNPQKLDLTTFDSKQGWLNWVKYVFQIENNNIQKSIQYGCEDRLIEELHCEILQDNCNLNIDGEFLQQYNIQKFQIEKTNLYYYTYN